MINDELQLFTCILLYVETITVSTHTVCHRNMCLAQFWSSFSSTDTVHADD